MATVADLHARYLSALTEVMGLDTHLVTEDVLLERDEARYVVSIQAGDDPSYLRLTLGLEMSRVGSSPAVDLDRLLHLTNALTREVSASMTTVMCCSAASNTSPVPA